MIQSHSLKSKLLLQLLLCYFHHFSSKIKTSITTELYDDAMLFSPHSRIVQVKAFSHQGYPVKYKLTTESGQESVDFAIDRDTGYVDLLRRLDYERDPQQYHLRVKAVEHGRPERTSTVSVSIIK